MVAGSNWTVKVRIPVLVGLTRTPRRLVLYVVSDHLKAIRQFSRVSTVLPKDLPNSMQLYAKSETVNRGGEALEVKHFHSSKQLVFP